LVEGVTRLSGGRIDAIVANAGGGPPETMLSLNFFGVVATLEGLRPLLEGRPSPRAVMVSSIASLSPTDQGLVEACLNADERAAKDALVEGKVPLDLYGSAKLALNRWCRRVASEPQWAGAGIPLECDCARRHRHAGRRFHPVGSRSQSAAWTHGSDARRVSRPA
jgi:NAD(P)-dependent dehydrogenase (short-subunit alcohol dehydrogenase family)